MLLLFAGGTTRRSAVSLPVAFFPSLPVFFFFSHRTVPFRYGSSSPPIDASVPLIGWVDELCRKYNKPPRPLLALRCIRSQPFFVNTGYTRNLLVCRVPITFASNVYKQVINFSPAQNSLHLINISSSES